MEYGQSARYRSLAYSAIIDGEQSWIVRLAYATFHASNLRPKRSDVFWTRTALCELLTVKNTFLFLLAVLGAHTDHFSLRLYLPFQEHTTPSYPSWTLYLTKTGSLVPDLQAFEIQRWRSRCGLNYGFHNDSRDFPSDQRLDLLSDLLRSNGVDHDDLWLRLLWLGGWLLVLGLYFTARWVWEKYLFLLNDDRTKCLLYGTTFCRSLCKFDILQRLRLCFDDIFYVYWHALVQLCIQQFRRSRLTKYKCQIISYSLTRKHVLTDNSTPSSEFFHQ